MTIIIAVILTAYILSITKLESTRYIVLLTNVLEYCS